MKKLVKHKENRSGVQKIYMEGVFLRGLCFLLSIFIVVESVFNWVVDGCVEEGKNSN